MTILRPLNPKWDLKEIPPWARVNILCKCDECGNEFVGKYSTVIKTVKHVCKKCKEKKEGYQRRTEKLECYGVSDTIRMLGIGKSTLCDWTKAGRIRCVRVNGIKLYPINEIKKLAQELGLHEDELSMPKDPQVVLGEVKLNKRKLVTRSMFARIVGDLMGDRRIGRKAVDAFVDAVADVLREGGKVSILNFGLFYTKKMSYAYKNKRTGKVERTPELRWIRFRPSKTFTEYIQEVDRNENQGEKG